MSIRYHDRVGHLVPDYVCQKKAIQQGRPVCQRITGEQIDKAVSDILVRTMTPLALEVALTVQQELQSRLDDADRLRQKRVERARYEAELAQRRYMNVDPCNRLVADTLEADWDQKYAYDLKDRFSRLRAAGLMTMEEMAVKPEVLPCTVKKWRGRGLLHAHRYNDKGECLYESPDVLLPRKFAHKRSYLAAKEPVLNSPDEVQCEA